MFEASTKIINNYLAAHQQNVFQLGTYYNMFGTKQNIVKEPKSIILMISVWQTRYRSQTYEFTCYTANMCYDPRQFWPTPTKDSYFPLRKLDLKRFAEATKTIWINNWIRLQFM